VVIDGATGRLAPPGDWQALASCVLDLLDHPDDARSMARAASERLLEFDESTMVRRTRELYRELVGEVAHRR
jgi:glycosyltransferase involved in cell wall biosynthesis